MASISSIFDELRKVSTSTGVKFIGYFFNPVTHFYIKRLNDYLRAHFHEPDLTQFNFFSLMKLFKWDARPKNAYSVAEQAVELLSDGDVFYDIGGNVCRVTLNVLAKRNVVVTLFEPVPVYRDFCRLAVADYHGVTVVGKALSDCAGVETIYVDRYHLGWNTLVKEEITANMSPVQIETITLDQYWLEAGAPQVAVLKIDVEGAECRVINGAKQMLSSQVKKPPIFLEIGWRTKHPQRSQEVAALEWLFKNGCQRFDYNTVRHYRCFDFVAVMRNCGAV